MICLCVPVEKHPIPGTRFFIFLLFDIVQTVVYDEHVRIARECPGVSTQLDVYLRSDDVRESEELPQQDEIPPTPSTEAPRRWIKELRETGGNEAYKNRNRNRIRNYTVQGFCGSHAIDFRCSNRRLRPPPQKAALVKHGAGEQPGILRW